MVIAKYDEHGDQLKGRLEYRIACPQIDELSEQINGRPKDHSLSRDGGQPWSQ